MSYKSCLMTTPSLDHWIAKKCILHYVKRTPKFSILYGQTKDPWLINYTNSDWGGSVDDKKSTSSYVFNLGIGVITWTSKKQQVISLSSTKLNSREESKQVVRQASFEGCFPTSICLKQTLHPSFVAIKGSSNLPKIQPSMSEPSILTFIVTLPIHW